MLRIRRLILLASVCILPAGSLLPANVYANNADELTLVLPYLLSEDINHEDYYFSRLLDSAFNATTKTDGPWQHRHFHSWLRDKRLRLALQRGEVDVIWSQTNPDLEKSMLAVKFPLLKGLSNYRLFLINKGDQPRFSRIKTLTQLAELRGGMGAQWPDVTIMESNKLPLEKIAGYGKLFKMLAARRFDYFPRGIYQIQSELHFYPQLPLEIEQTLMLHYHSETYFFVHPDNQRLADRLLRGLQIIRDNGEFDTLFNSIPRYRWAAEELQKQNRRVLYLQ